LTDKTVTLTIVDGDRGMEIATDLALPQPGIRFPRLLAMLGVALLGGLILNLMPCVLPVLSLKILAVISHGGGEKHEVRSSFLATAAGIIVSFLALAAATSVVKLAGSAVGWGVQFQQPIFLGVMIGLITLFAANLFGWFEIPLPQFLADIGANAGPSKGWAGHFATGAFATLLATPCSAPSASRSPMDCSRSSRSSCCWASAWRGPISPSRPGRSWRRSCRVPAIGC